MKKKQIMSAAAAFMMAAAIPLSGIPSMFTSTDSIPMVAVAADEESTNLKTGDLVTIKKSDYDITQKSDNLVFPDRLYVYATRLDETGEKSLVGYLDADSAIDETSFTYNSQYGYILHNSHGTAGNNPGSDSYYYLNADGTWKTFYASGGKSHAVTPPLSILFDDDSLGDLTYMISDDTPITVYMKNSDGESEFYKTVYKNDIKSVMFFSGLDYEKYTWSVDVDYTEVYERAEKHVTGTVTGAWLASKPYIKSKDLKVTTTPTSEPNDPDVITPPRAILFNLEFPKTDDNGKTIYDKDGKPVMSSLDEIEHGDAWIIKNTETVQEISAGDLKYSVPVIEDYDTNAVYFIKVGLDSANKDFLYYRYNPRSGWWDFRVNTADTPMYNAPITATAFQNEFADGVMYNKKSTSGSYEGNEVDSWTKKEFALGDKTSSILTNNNNYTYTALFDYGADGGIYYQYVGIDPIPVYAYGNRANGPLINRNGVLTNADAGDTLIIDGTDPDGNHVHYEVVQPFDNDYVPVGDGDYTITNVDKGIEGRIEDGKIPDIYTDPDSEDAVLNLVDPISTNSYVIKDINGEVVSEGELKGETPKSIDNLISDIGMPSKQIDWMKNESYYAFESESGIFNSTNPDDYIKDSGYFIFDNSADAAKGDIIRIYTTGVKGDVNQDGVFNVADAVMEQKYLLNALDKDHPFKMENFIASDVCVDGSGNCFDLCILKRMLVEQGFGSENNNNK